MARLQATRRQTRKGSKKLTDAERAMQIAGFQASEVAKFSAAREKMTDEEKEDEIASVRKQLGILPRKKPDVKPPDVAESPYEVDTTKDMDMTEQAAAPTPEDTIDIGDNNDNDDKDKEDNNTLHPRTARKQGCENDPEQESLFSGDRNDDHDENDPMTIILNQSMTRLRRRIVKERTPRVSFRSPGKLTGQSGYHLPRKRRQQFWLRLA